MTEPNLRDIVEVVRLSSDETLDVEQRVNEYLDVGWALVAAGVLQVGDGTPDRPSYGFTMYVVGRPRGVETRPAERPRHERRVLT